jgi:excinuclease UvrABC helicase subunit UvrB
MDKDFGGLFDEFDELFNEMFKKDGKNMFNRLNNSNNNDFTPIDINNIPPTSVTTYTEGGYQYKESIWETDGGTIKKVELLPTNKTIGEIKSELENDLIRAVEDENYELAAKIRDEINSLKE